MDLLKSTLGIEEANHRKSIAPALGRVRFLVISGLDITHFRLIAASSSALTKWIIFDRLAKSQADFCAEILGKGQAFFVDFIIQSHFFDNGYEIRDLESSAFVKIVKLEAVTNLAGFHS